MIDSKPIGPSKLGDPIHTYFTELKSVLFRPRTFFRSIAPSENLNRALAFALVTHWIGVAIQHIWLGFSMRAGEEMLDRYTDIMRRFSNHDDDIAIFTQHFPRHAIEHHFSDWFFGTGSVIADPFLTLLSLMMSSVFVFVGARLLVSGGEKGPTFESVVRILAYAMGASIFLGLPWMGAFIAGIYGLYIAVIGAKELYRIGTGRALAVVLFPKLLAIGIFFSFAAMIFVFFFKFLSIFSGA